MNEVLYEKALEDMMRDKDVLELEKYSQHGATSTLDHCLHVTRTAGKIAKQLNLKISEEELVRGSMLHDYYLYDFKNEDVGAYQHGTGHAQIALDNASEIYDLTDKECNIIYSHMWPLNITHLPRCKESLLVCVADKYCAAKEMLQWTFNRK